MSKLFVSLVTLAVLTRNVMVVMPFAPSANFLVIKHHQQANSIWCNSHKEKSNRQCTSFICLYAFPIFNWFQRKEQTPEGIEIPKEFTSGRGKPDEEELMHRTVKMIENHRRSQEAAERTATIMEELSTSFVTGRSKAGSGAMGLGGSGVKVIFDGTSRPISVEVDPNFLFSPPESGVISVEDLNAAITEAMHDGYQQSGKLMGEKMKTLYEQLGLPREGGK
ncbi:hypothetical protein ACHAWX_004608 [Stephanocyclus meneghinianus]